MYRADKSRTPFGSAARAPPVAPLSQERATTSVTISGAEAGLDEVIDNTQTSTTEAPASEPVQNGFEALGLSPELLKAVADSGYTTPTPIQAQTIPLALQRRDVIGIAQTGTGKTASFTLPMIEMLSKGRAKARMPRALVLEPTRELADQVSESFDKYSKYSKLTHALLIGGTSMDEQIKKLDRGVDVLIATPGRLMDHFNRGRILLSQVNILVIDEADRMLDMGFIPDVEEICKKLPFTRQTLFYSATMPPEITRLTEQFLHNPVRIEVSRPATTAANIVQQIVEIPANDWAKREALRRLIREAEPTLNNAIVFCNRKRDVDVVAKSLVKHGFDAAPIHGDLDQSLRTRTLERFRAGDLKILVASDVAARGLDVPAVSHVFNFDVPIHADDYVHRIGRTGRAGRSGATFMLASHRDGKYIEAIEKITGQKLDRREMMDIEVREDVRPRRDDHKGGGKGGGRERGRGGRDGKQRDRRPPGGKFHDQVASMDPVDAPAVAAEAPAVEAPRPQAERPPQPKEQRQPRNDAPRPEKPRQEPRQEQRPRNEPRQENRQENREPRNDKRERGGQRQYNEQAAKPEAVDKSQLPAFLFRPVPVKKPEPQSD
ncbi:MAG: ATP-dependent helicase, box family [Alphaproteobacteria bacterium]|nr:ATP-dependent helicase, box family [Alphaproteobacteria bacterium]